MERKQIIEALLFCSQEPLTLARMQSVLASDDRKGILDDLESLKREYEEMDRAFRLVEVAGGFQFRTKPEMAAWIRKLRNQRTARLSQASMETLAIIAYRQPVTRSEIEYVRGVDCGAVLRRLLEKGLVRIMGRKDAPGRPLIYGTSRRFLEVFSLKNLSSLPELSEVQELEDHPSPVDRFSRGATGSEDRGEGMD